MIPEREAQMREMFQKKYGKRPTNDPLLEATWDDRKRVWDYCLNSLEPMVRDGERYAWIKENADVTFHEEQEWPISDDQTIYSRMPAAKELDKAVDAAMSAALEDGNETDY